MFTQLIVLSVEPMVIVGGARRNRRILKSKGTSTRRTCIHRGTSKEMQNHCQLRRCRSEHRHGNSLVELIKPACKATCRPGCDADLGGFGGLHDDDVKDPTKQEFDPFFSLEGLLCS